MLPLEGNRTPWVFLKTPFREGAGWFSPDGHWVAYQSNESGRTEVYVRPFVGAAPFGAGTTAAGEQWQVSTTGGLSPMAARRQGTLLPRAHRRADGGGVDNGLGR